MKTRSLFRAPLFALLLSLLVVYGFGQSPLTEFDRPRTYDVLHYSIGVRFDRPHKTVFGDTVIRLKPLADEFTTAEFDAVGITFASVTLEPGKLALKYRRVGGKIKVTLDKAYTAGTPISIRFKYTAAPKKGVYFIDEKRSADGIVNSAQIWTQGEADEARHWLPSFDFPSDKATSEEFITADKGETVIGNGELIEEIPNPDGSVTHHFKMPIPHPTYLISFIIGKYVKQEEQYGDIPLGYYVYPGSEDLVKLAYGETVDYLRIFEGSTGVKYPFNKYDQTTVAGFTFGGMENITATTMADSEIRYARLDFIRGNIHDLVSHELAHSWFGNNVTCRNWAELWLNEGFATFMEAVAREKLNGRKDYLRKIGGDAETFKTDDENTRGRFGLYNRTAANTAALFDRAAITYNKGGAVLHQLREQVGDEAFWKAVNIYLNRHRFDSVTTPDLRRAMEEASGQDLGWFFEQWVYGVGHPQVNIQWQWAEAGKTLEFTVTQTQRAGGLVPAAFRLPLELEMKFADGSTRRERLEINSRRQSFSFTTDSDPAEIKFDPDSKLPLISLRTPQVKKSPVNISGDDGN